MVNTLDLDLRPGSGIGPFELGASLFDVLAFLRQPSPPTFPSVSVNFDTSKPVVSPIILHLRPHLHLRFTPLTQRLHTISLSLRRDPTAHPPLVLSYKNEVLSGPDVVLRRTAVQRMMGPTYKGDSMSYPGVWFSFEEDTHGMPTNNGTSVAEGNTEVKRVVVTQRSEQSEHEQKEDADELAPNSIMYGDIQKAIIKLHDGIYLHFYTPESDMPPIHVRLGITTAEDLTCDLGPPVLTHYKEDDRMAIHATAQDDEESYFYNYFQHGLDFLISGKTHRVRKIIVHTNVPGSPLFQRYKRCPWEIELNPSDTNLLVATPEATPSSSPAPESNVPATKQTGKKKKKKHDVEQVQATRASFEVRDDAPSRTNNNTVTFDEAIDTLRAQLNPSGTKHSAQPSMQLERTADLPHHELITLPNATTQLLAFDGVVCEASEMGDLLSLVLF